jgi:hypothetical protein
VSVLYDYTTSPAYDIIALTNIDIKFYTLSFGNPLWPQFQYHKYWSLGFGTPYLIGTTSDGSSSDVVYMTFQPFFNNYRQIYLMRISYGGVSYLSSKYQNGRQMYAGGTRGSVMDFDVFNSNQCLCLLLIGSNLRVAKYTGLHNGGSADLHPDYLWPVSIPSSNNPMMKWVRGTTNVIVVNPVTKQVYWFNYITSVAQGPTSISPQSYFGG